MNQPPRRRQQLESALPPQRLQPSPLVNQKLTKLLIITLVVAGLAVGLVWLAFKSSQSAKLTYVNNPDYPSLQTAIKENQIDQLGLKIHYPVTANSKIDHFTRQAIDRMVAEFQADFTTVQSDASATIDVNYDIYRHDKLATSISVIGSYRVDKRPVVVKTRGWTFDAKTGRVLTLADLVNSETGRKIVLGRLEAQLKHELGVDYAPSKTLTIKDFRSFVVEGRQAAIWRFTEGAIAPTKHGEVQVRLQLDRWLKQYFNTELSKKLFDLDNLAQSSLAAIGDCRHYPCLALTFDDGPSDRTPELLATLGKAKVKTSFFVLGTSLNKHPEMVKQLADGGHDIGNHTWRHRNLNSLPLPQVRFEIHQNHARIQELAGRPPIFMRPPYGIFNQRVGQVAAEQGSALILWSIDPRDWDVKNSQVICDRVVADAKPGGIVLMHDTVGASIDAMPCIIDNMSKRGWRIVSVSELLGSNLIPGRAYYHQ